MPKRLFYFALILFLLADIGYSFMQHLSQPLDGDMAWNIVPANDVKPILTSPFGFSAIIHSQKYPNPNRFFCHWMFREYGSNVPHWLQNFVQPIDSVYLSFAIAKILIQLLIIFLLSAIITGTTKIFSFDFLVAAVLITPLFQTNGYRSYMGIIDPSATYTFFYALPLALLLLYFLPFIFQYYHNKRDSLHPIISILWIPLAVVVCLSGPLNPGVALIFSMLAFFGFFKSHFGQEDSLGPIKRGIIALKKIPRGYWLCLLPISILSFYSLYLGQYNSNNVNLSLAELYSRLPQGIYYQFTQKLGFPILFLVLALNTVIIKKYHNGEAGKKLLTTFKWVGVFALVYILLLPLGGFRDYRPNTLRYDTIMPITLSLIFMFGITTLFLIKHISPIQRWWYLPLVFGVLFLFTNADKPEFEKNVCERHALQQISESKDSVVVLHNNCTVLSWDIIVEPKYSELNGQLLKMWGITKVKKLYYQQLDAQ